MTTPGATGAGGGRRLSTQSTEPALASSFHAAPPAIPPFAAPIHARRHLAPAQPAALEHGRRFAQPDAWRPVPALWFRRSVAPFRSSILKDYVHRQLELVLPGPVIKRRNVEGTVESEFRAEDNRISHPMSPH